MKIKANRWIGFLVATLVLLVSLNSCVKNRNDLGTDFTKLENVVDLPVNGFKALAFDVTPVPQVVKVYVELGGPIPDRDVEVTLAFDQVGLDVYNAANTDTTVTATNPTPTGDVTHFEKLPDSAFSLSNLKVTIKKGERLGSVDLTIIPSKVDLNLQNAIALKIIDAQGFAIAENLKSVIYAIIVKNKYDGQYSLKIKTIGWAAYGIADGVSNTLASIGLVTASANTVTFTGDFQPAFTTAGTQTGFGATRPIFAFDLTTDKLISVTNDPGVVDSRNRQFHLNPLVTDSRFDAATKTIYAAYIMTQNSRPDQQIYDTLTYTGPRP